MVILAQHKQQVAHTEKSDLKRTMIRDVFSPHSWQQINCVPCEKVHLRWRKKSHSTRRRKRNNVFKCIKQSGDVVTTFPPHNRHLGKCIWWSRVIISNRSVDSVRSARYVTSLISHSAIPVILPNSHSTSKHRVHIDEESLVDIHCAHLVYHGNSDSSNTHGE